MNIMRQLTIIPYDEDTKKEIYKQLDDWRYHSWLLANDIYSRLYSVTMEMFREYNNNPELKMKDVKTSIIEKQMKYAKGKAKPTEMSWVYEISKENRYSENLHSHVRSALSQRVLKDFQSDSKNGLFKGNKSIRNYRRESMNIFLPIGIPKKDKDGNKIPGSGAMSGITKDNGQYTLYTSGKLKFKIILGRDRSNNRAIIENVLNGKYKMCDSFIKRGKKGYNYFLNVSIPDKDNKLDTSLSVGVDLGISTPAVCALSKGHARAFIGNGKDVLNFRFQMNKRRDQAKRACSFAKGGKGRKKKLRSLDRFKELESNWIKNYNHNISRQIIDFALKHRAGTIKLEMLDGFGSEHKDNVVLKNWTYYQLTDMIKYKAKMEGIVVVQVDPYHTSKVCSFCGKVHENLSLKDREIECECGEKYNRDYNASVNIARSTNVVTKKDQCQYHKLKKKEEAKVQ